MLLLASRNRLEKGGPWADLVPSWQYGGWWSLVSAWPAPFPVSAVPCGCWTYCWSVFISRVCTQQDTTIQHSVSQGRQIHLCGSVCGWIPHMGELVPPVFCTCLPACVHKVKVCRFVFLHCNSQNSPWEIPGELRELQSNSGRCYLGKFGGSCCPETHLLGMGIQP